MQRRFYAPLAIAVLAATPLLAADTLAWPWTSKMPPDPALVVLPKVDSVTASIDKEIVKISVKATAPTAGYSEFAFTPRIGDPKDRIFAFDIRGRAPQGVAAPAETQVAVDSSYTGAPIGKFDVIEVYAKDNCIGYSLTDAKQVDCASKSVPQ
jgi:hypothetical protein